MKLTEKQWTAKLGPMKFGVGLEMPERGDTPGEGVFIPTDASFDAFEDAISEAGAVDVEDVNICGVIGLMFDINSPDEIPEILKTVAFIASRTLVFSKKRR
jgi:hypothetical protein